MREQLEQRRAEAAKKKQDEERTKAEEDKKVRAAELEEKKRLRMELERKRREREEKIAMANREKAIKEEAEKAAVKAKVSRRSTLAQDVADQQAEEENKKRKLAQAALLKKSATAVAASSSSSTFSTAPVKGKDPLRTIKPVYPLPSVALTTIPGVSKLGPTAFRTAETSTAGGSTITLVQPKTGLGPPSRPSSQLPLQNQGYQPQGYQPKTSTAPLAVLQQSRVQLQSHLDEKALETQSEDIVLPDIASEYVLELFMPSLEPDNTGTLIQTLLTVPPISNDRNGPNRPNSAKLSKRNLRETPTSYSGLSSRSTWKNCSKHVQTSLERERVQRIGTEGIG